MNHYDIIIVGAGITGLYLANKIKDVAKKENATPRIYLSHSQNPKKDPLSYNDKYRFATKNDYVIIE